MSRVTPPTSQRTPTRLDIQGLRAIAVLSVIAAHASLPLPGGFVGVDIFFVISGFIITTVLLREYQNHGQIRLGSFYLRRFKRLAPALAALTCFTVLSALLLSAPKPMLTSLQTALGATFGVANAVIANNSSNYFGTVAEHNFLLHTWSLSVEEQFYLAFPALLLLGLWATRKRPDWLQRLILTIAGLALAGFSLLAIRGIGPIASTAFPLGYYGPVNRAWEFLAGVLIALLTPYLLRLPKLIRELCALAGGLGLIAAFSLINPETPFPGKWTLLPVLAACLLIVAGLGTGSIISKLLSLKPITTIGDWSYSLYLWHWPFIAIAKILAPYNPSAPVIGAVIAFGPAYLSYRYLEQPLRNLKTPQLNQKLKLITTTLAVPALTALGALVTLSLLIQPAFSKTGTWRSRFGEVVKPETPDSVLAQCEDPKLAFAPKGMLGGCLAPAGTRKPTVLVIGDSHAGHIAPGIRAKFPNLQFVALSYTTPYPLTSPQDAQNVLNYIKEHPTIHTVIISAQFTRKPSGLLSIQREVWPQIAKQVRAAGRELSVLNDIPVWPTDVFRCAYRRGLVLPGTDCTAPRKALLPTKEQIDTQLKQAFNGIDGVSFVNTYDTFCNQDSCHRASSTELYYTDGNHLTPIGAKRLIEYATANNPQFAAALIRKS